MSRRQTHEAGDSWRKFTPVTTAPPPRHEFVRGEFPYPDYCAACNRYYENSLHIWPEVSLGSTAMFWLSCAALGALLAFAVIGVQLS